MFRSGLLTRWSSVLLTWLVALLVALEPTSASLNLYLTTAEVQRILGLTAELFYVREGVVNEYAMGWTVPVPAHVHALHFIWRATDNTPLLYNIALRTEDPEKDDSQDTKSKDRLDEKKQSRKHKTKDKNERKGPVVLAPPYLNISLSGNVPTEPTTFTLHLPCTGAASAEVDVTLNINVTSPRPNLPPIELYFRRRKICLQGQSSEAYAPHQDPKEEATPLVSPTLYYGLCGAGALLMVLLSILGAAFVRRRIREKRHRDHCTLTSNCGSDQKSRAGTSSSLLSPISNNVYTPTNHTYTPSTHTYTLPSSVTSNCYASLTQLPVSPTQTLPHPPTQTLPRDSSSVSAQEQSVSAASLATPAGNTSVASLTYGPMSTASLSHPAKISASLARDCSLPSFRPATTASQSGSKNCTLTTMASGGGSRNSTLNKRELLVDPCMAHMQESFKHLQVDRRRVRLTCVLLEGRYGRLYRGCIQADSPLPDTQVLVKTVQCTAGQQQVRQLCREVVRLANVQHRTLLSLAAVSLGASAPPLFIFPDVAFHNLKLFLKSRSVHLTPGDLQQVALQAAQALAFLHSCNILHSDLAARNCFITDQLQLRVADSALSDDLFPEDYHALPQPKSGGDTQSAVRPIAWMALEAITEGVTSQPADVWSWGVLAWELSTLAQQPYQDLAMTLLPDYLRDGYRLAQPSTCPDVLYQLMAFCWAINPQHRPRAALLVEYLLGLTQQPFSSLNQTLVPTVHDFQLSNHIPASSFLHNSASAGADLKRLNQGYHSTLMNTSASVTGDVKSFPHQFHSNSFNPSSSCAISKSDLKGLSQLAPHYSQPASLMANGVNTTEEGDTEADSNDASGGDVYSTPSTSEADVQPWRFNSQRPPNGAVSVPPPLPPANGSLPSVRAPRPQQPLPNMGNTIVL